MRAPTVIGELADVVDLSKVGDSDPDERLVDDVAFGGLDETLPNPRVIGHAVAAKTGLDILLGDPEEGEDAVERILICWREEENEGRDVG